MRVIITAVFFNLMLGIVFLIVTNVATIGAEGMDIAEMSNRVGGYAVFAVIATAVLLPLDFMFSSLSSVVLKKLPPIAVKKPPLSECNEEEGKKIDEQNGDEADKPREKKYDDVFGYEIVENDDADGTPIGGKNKNE